MAEKDYIARINRVIDYIEERKGESLTLNELAEVAHLSPFHFHRIFRAFMREPLGKYVQRIRLNWAAGKLVNDPDLPITRIALDSGFSSSASFAHAFKQQWGMSAKEFRATNPTLRNFDQLDGKNPTMMGNPSVEWEVRLVVPSGVPFTQHWRITMKQASPLNADVTIKDIDPIPVIYVRHVGPYAGDEKLFERLFTKLYTWAGPRDLIGPNSQVITIYHDSPEVVEEEKLRISCCLSVPEGTKGEGEIGTMSIPGGRYAVAHFELNPEQYGDAWMAVYAGWLPESGYVCDDRPSFERYLRNPEEHPEHKHDVEIWLPVKPA